MSYLDISIIFFLLNFRADNFEPQCLKNKEIVVNDHNILISFASTENIPI